ncbi:MAG: LytTR family DNA-binding domain-containing protein [Bacteroidia bacterium]|jgi:two-component system LytT family response regulator|nr:LytTR family DNA-binding domain-containing protein [Bacteroidia bacterium]
MYRAIIIDDEKAGIESLMILAARYARDIKIVATTRYPEEAAGLIEDYDPDIVFLDVRMPKMTGFDLLAQLPSRDFKLVFTTAYSEYAIQAIRNQAFDYLLKPISDDMFCEFIASLGDKQDKPHAADDNRRKAIEIAMKDGIQFLPQPDIIRLEASRSYTEIFMDNGVRHIASRPLKDFENRLDTSLFFRCHKSHIVNLHKVKKFVTQDGFFLLMTDGSLPEVSRVIKDDLLARLREK